MMEVIGAAFSRCSELLGVQWAPLNVPMSRRLQTLGAAGWICLVLFGEFLSIVIFLQLVYSSLWWLAIIYAIWMLNDLDACNRGGRMSEWTRNWAWWRYYCDYFPINLVKTTDLDPSKNYLLACYPHGVVCSGTFGAFATNALNCHKLFPGLRFHLITLGGHFLVPLFRDLALSLGMCSPSKESLLYLLDKKKNTGKCAVLLVGGAAEALDSHPGEYKVILKRRKGFIRVAMMTGAPIVPVFSFGEPDVFHPLNNPKDGWLRWFQEKVRSTTGISPMFPIGRGMFQYSFGVVPFRSPITVVDLHYRGYHTFLIIAGIAFTILYIFTRVVLPLQDLGEPIEVPKNLEPSDEEVNALHSEFTQRLVNLFESEKSKYLKTYQNVHLVIT